LNPPSLRFLSFAINMHTHLQFSQYIHTRRYSKKKSNLKRIIESNRVIVNQTALYINKLYEGLHFLLLKIYFSQIRPQLRQIAL